MSKDPRDWFAVDADLWQTPGPKKLKWWQRKVAIYLRKCSGVYDDGGEQKADLVLRSVKRIAQDTDLTISKVEKSITRLRSWPSRRQSFVQKCSGTEITLRPISKKFVRCPVWLWESPLPDDLKDVFLFVRSQFRMKSVDNEELFNCNRFGLHQPSIYQCCHLSGKHYKERRSRVVELVSFLVESGLLVVSEWFTRDRAMVVSICDREPVGIVSKAMSELSGATKPVSQVQRDQPLGATKEVVGCNEISSRVHTKQNPYSQSSYSKSFSDPAPSDALAGRGPGIKIIEIKDRKLTEIIESIPVTLEVLKACCQELDLDRGILSYEQSAIQLRSLVQEISESDGREELLIVDLLWALKSEVWNGLEPALGLRLSKNLSSRLREELLVSLYYRKAQAEEARQKTPAGMFQKMLLLRYQGFSPEFSWSFDISNFNDSWRGLNWLIWNDFPHHRCHFQKLNEVEYDCSKPSEFLTDEETNELYSKWLGMAEEGTAEAA